MPKRDNFTFITKIKNTSNLTKNQIGKKLKNSFFSLTLV